MRRATDRQPRTVHVRLGGTMSQVPPQRASCGLAVEPEELIARLSESLERTISFAEECRWRFPELSAEADQLAAGAMALFGKSIQSLRGTRSPDS